MRKQTREKLSEGIFRLRNFAGNLFSRFLELRNIKVLYYICHVCGHVTADLIKCGCALKTRFET